MSKVWVDDVVERRRDVQFLCAMFSVLALCAVLVFVLGVSLGRVGRDCDFWEREVEVVGVGVAHGVPDFCDHLVLDLF